MRVINFVAMWKAFCSIYCEIILIRWGQCSWICWLRGDVISWVTGLLHYNARQFITLLNIRWDVNSWVRARNPRTINPKNNDFHSNTTKKNVYFYQKKSRYFPTSYRWSNDISHPRGQHEVPNSVSDQLTSDEHRDYDHQKS